MRNIATLFIYRYEQVIVQDLSEVTVDSIVLSFIYLRGLSQSFLNIESTTSIE